MESTFFALIDFQALLVFLASFLVAGFILLTKRYHGHLSMDGHKGIQKFHTYPTPRVGGIAI